MSSHVTPVRTLVVGRFPHAIPYACTHRDVELVGVRWGERAFEALRPTHDGGIELDAVVVCLPPALRAPIVRAALERGLPVLCEDSVTDTAKQSAEISWGERASEARVMFGSLHRHDSAVPTWFGPLGKVALTIPQALVPEEGPRGHRGLLADVLAQVLARLGDVVDRADLASVAVTAMRPGAAAIEDGEAFAMLTFAREPGAGARTTVSIAAAPGGRLLGDGCPVRRVAGGEMSTLALAVFDGLEESTYAEVQRFVARVQGLEPWSPDTADVRWAQRIVAALERSMTGHGRPVVIANRR